MNMEEVLAARKLREDETWVPLDDDLLAQIRRAEEEVAKRDTPDTRAALDELLEQAEGAAVLFKFRQLPTVAYRKLVSDHPPKQVGYRWHEPTFAPALIAATVTEPAMTVRQAERMYAEWGEDAFLRIYATAISVNEGQATVPFSVTSTGATPSSAKSSTTAPSEESPTQSS